MYGGWRAFATSVYVYIALGLTLLLHPLWCGHEPEWVSDAKGIAPSLLGFSMGGMAIMLAFSSGKFMEAVADPTSDTSYYLRTIGSFFHFILFQTLALILALITSAYPITWISALGFWVFAYSLLTALATAGQLLSMARIVNVAEGRAPTDDK